MGQRAGHILEAHCSIFGLAHSSPGQVAIFSRREGKWTSLDKPEKWPLQLPLKVFRGNLGSAGGQDAAT